MTLHRSEQKLLKKDSLIIFSLGLVLFLIGLNPEFISFQARFALFAKEMMWHGITFFPTTYQIPYPDYPSTSTFMIYLTSLLFGKVTPFSAALPTALTSSLILVFTYRLGALHSRLWGGYAVLLMLFTQFFFTASRSISPDQYVSLATLLSFYLLYTATLYNQPYRLRFLPLILVMSFAFRGPIGLVIPTGVICSYYLYDRNYKKLFITACWTVTLLMLCMGALFFAAYLQGGKPFVHEVLKLEILSRMGHNTRRMPFYFYWIRNFSSYAISYPLALIVIASQAKKIIQPQNEKDKFLGYLASWILIIMIGMSIPGDKKIRYLLSLVPALSLTASYLFVGEIKLTFLRGLRKLFIAFCSLLPFLLLILTAASVIVNIRAFRFHLPFIPVIVILIFLILLTIATWHQTLSETRKNITLFAIAVCAYLTFHVGIIDPTLYSLERTKPFVDKIVTLQKKHPASLVFYRIGPDAEDIKFYVNLDRPLSPGFLQTEEELLTHNEEPAYFIALQEDFNALSEKTRNQFRTIAFGKIGHKRCLVFKFKQKEYNNGRNQHSYSSRRSTTPYF